MRLLAPHENKHLSNTYKILILWYAEDGHAIYIVRLAVSELCGSKEHHTKPFERRWLML